jgi:hypothetical protein
MNRKIIIAVSLILLVLTGCGSGSSNPATQQIAITFWSSPPSTITVSGAANMSAKLINDLSNGGVVWSCTPVGACGTFSPAQTSSAYATTFTAPPAIPPDGTIMITATSVTDPSVTITSSLTITPIPIAIGLIGDPLPSLVPTSATAMVGALVSYDNANAGVSWSCTPLSNCGTFSQNPSPSGTLITYTAPPIAPAGGRIIITATSVSDQTKQVSNSLVVSGTASNATFNGKYSFSLSAPNGNRGITSLLGSVTVDGNGNVIDGVLDLISPSLSDLHDQILPNCTNPSLSSSIYRVDPNGHGRMRTCTANGQEFVFSFVLTSPSHALIIEEDGNPASGSLDLQNPSQGGFAPSQIAGGYSFTMTGTNATNPTSKIAFGGLLTADGVSQLSAGQLDVNTDGVLSTTSDLTGTFTAPDSYGRGTFALPSVGRTFIYYIVSSKALRLEEADSVALMGGSAFAQGAPLAPFSGAYVYQHSGWVPGGSAVDAGQFGIDTTSGKFLGGTSDSAAANAPGSISTGTPVTATTGVSVKISYSIYGSQIGKLAITDAVGDSTFNMYSVDPTINILDPNNPTNGVGGLLLLHTDSTMIGTGMLLPQSVGSYLANQVLNLTNLVNTATTPNELDLVGVMLSDGAGTLNPGTADYDQNASGPDPILGTPLTGFFQADLNHLGRSTGTISVPSFGAIADYLFVPPATTTFNASFYQIDDSQAFVLETDGFAVVSGTMQQQALP